MNTAAQNPLSESTAQGGRNRGTGNADPATAVGPAPVLSLTRN